LRLVIFDPPSVKILHGVLHDHQYPCHLILLRATLSSIRVGFRPQPFHIVTRV
jgi:hypothetical protein